MNESEFLRTFTNINERKRAKTTNERPKERGQARRGEAKQSDARRGEEREVSERKTANEQTNEPVNERTNERASERASEFPDCNNENKANGMIRTFTNI